MNRWMRTNTDDRARTGSSAAGLPWLNSSNGYDYREEIGGWKIGGNTALTWELGNEIQLAPKQQFDVEP
jgi:hypothetical protein